MNSDDGSFPEGCLVETRFPLTQEQHDGDRDTWPWLRGTIERQVGSDEWQVCVEDRRVAARKDGSRPTSRTPAWKLYYPLCFRGAAEGVMTRQDEATRKATTRNSSWN